MSTLFFKDDIDIADFRILINLWDRKGGESDYFLDISSIATSDIKIVKERNMPDTLEVEIEYTQFKEKLNYEGSEPQNILMPFITEVKIQRNFETIFYGTLFHMSLALGAVGKELLTLKCCSWGQHYEKRFVSGAFHGTYPQIAQQLVLAGQREMNWFDNYAFEYTDEYFQGWTWSETAIKQQAYLNAVATRKAAKTALDHATDANRVVLQNAYNTAQDAEADAERALDEAQHPPRSNPSHWDGGVYLTSGQSMWTYSMYPCNTMGTDATSRYTLKPMTFSFWYRANSAGNNPTLKLSAHKDNEGEIGAEMWSHTVSVSNQADWVKVTTSIPSNTISDDVHWLKITANNINIDISDLDLYQTPEQGDAYDLDISIGEFEPLTHVFDNTRIRHYHLQNIKDALYNIAKLSNSDGINSETGEWEPDTFEYEFDENKKFNIYYQQGALIADPAFAAEYPGVIKSLTLERGLEDICNLSFASSEEEKTYEDAAGNEYTNYHKWASAYSSGGSMDRFGTQAEFKAFDAVHSYADLDAVAGSDLNIFDEVQNIPQVEIDSNIYNMGNVHLGDAVIVNVLTDEVFRFVNGTYRIYSITCKISKDSVERISLTLVPPTQAGLQLISFPKQYKMILNDIKRLRVENG